MSANEHRVGMQQPVQQPGAHDNQPVLEQDYGRLWRSTAICTAVVSLVPLILLAAVNFYQYNRASKAEAKYAIRRLTSNIKRSFEFFLEEQVSTLTYIIHDESFDELRSDAELTRILQNMRRSLPIRSVVDLGLIDANGNQLSYVGPYELHGKNYKDQEWFDKVKRRGVFVSDVFLGYRQSPHFVLAIWHESKDQEAYILRATIDTQILNEQIMTFSVRPTSDCFLVNKTGVLQTPSRRYGNVFEQCPLALPPEAYETEVMEWRDEADEPVILGCAGIEHSPFVLILLNRPSDVMGEWLTLRSESIVILVVGIVLILAVILWGSRRFVNRIRAADERRAAFLHNIEYTNRLASLGRLAAGTAHEINNPLAIINEKAGLLQDLFTIAGPAPPPPEKTIKLTESILRAVGRCSTITHRLLGFAKHMDVQNEPTDLHFLIKDLLAFYAKETVHRNLCVNLSAAEDVPTIESDHGQLQQVFLNLINNAFAAVSDGGSIEVAIARRDADMVSVAVTDNGVGIPAENLGKLFEPFFTTKKGYGTGLGLSITYGIVQKLGGHISVDSQLGERTCVTVALPISRSG